MASRLDQARISFEGRVDEAADFASRCAVARHGTTERRALVNAQIEWAHELATLKIIVASERFFEVTLGLYVLGNRTSRGFRARRLKKVNSSLPQILDIFRGDKEFVGWVEPAAVIERASRWLREGEPYQTTLSSAGQLLTYLKKMRNVVAHESDDASEKYASATRSLYGALPRRVTPGAQLLQPPPPAIPYLVGNNLFEALVGTYRLIGRQIVP